LGGGVGYDERGGKWYCGVGERTVVVSCLLRAEKDGVLALGLFAHPPRWIVQQKSAKAPLPSPPRMDCSSQEVDTNMIREGT